MMEQAIAFRNSKTSLNLQEGRKTGRKKGGQGRQEEMGEKRKKGEKGQERSVRGKKKGE